MIYRKRVLTLMLAGALLSLPAAGQVRQRSAPENPRSKVPEFMNAYRSRSDEGNITRAVLLNGMTVIVEEYPVQPVVAIGTFVKAGYFDESDEVAGISHVLEHMFFKGTAKRGVGQIARDTRLLGGVLNASTIYDHTWYYSVVPSENLNKAMEIQADALQNSALDSAELKKELEVIIEEGKRKLDTPAAFAVEKMLELAFEKHRMRRWRIGTEEGLRSITRDKIAAFYQQYYRPDRIVLAVSGDIQRDRVLEKVAELYGPFRRPSGAEGQAPGEPEQNSLRYRELRGDIQDSQVVFGYHGVGVEHPDYAPLLVLSEILGGGRGSILYRQLVEKQRLVDSCDVAQMSYAGAGMFLIQCTLDPAKIDLVEPAVVAEVELLRGRSVEPSELARAVTLLEKEHYRGLEGAESRAGQLAYAEAVLGDYKRRDTFVDKIRQVTAARVREAAQKYLKIENLSLLEYQPKGAPARAFDAAGLRASLDTLVPAVVEKRRGDGAAQAAVAAPASALSPAAPDFRRHTLQRTSILRGPQLYYREDHSLPLVDIAFLYPGGRFEEKEENQGITQLALSMAVRESDRYRDGALALALEALGGTIQVVNAPDYYGFILSILSRNLSQGVQLLAEVIQRPAFREETLSRERDLQVSRWKRIKDNNYAYPLQLGREAVFGNHSYGFSGLGTDKTLASLDVPKTEEWYRQNVTQVKPVVILLGDIQGTAIAEQVARDFSGTRYKDKTVTERKTVKMDQARERSDSRDIRQTATVIGFSGPAFSDRDGDVLDVIRSMVSGLGGRFFEELRDRQNLAYTVAVLGERNRFGGAIYGYIATSPGKAEEAEKALAGQFADFSAQPIREEEYYRSLVSTIGAHLIGLQSRFNYLNEIARYVILGGDAEPLEQYSERIKSITIDDIKAVATKYFVLHKRATAVVRGKN